jgi:hypothetical protein
MFTKILLRFSRIPLIDHKFRIPCSSREAEREYSNQHITVYEFLQTAAILLPFQAVVKLLPKTIRPDQHISIMADNVLVARTSISTTLGRAA